jgi:hypothetical protein
MIKKYFCPAKKFEILVYPHIRYIFIFLTLIGFGACSTDIDVNAPYKETKVIYCLIDPNSPFQMARISKGFQNEGRSALDIAQNNPDSSLYPPGIIKVELIEYSPTSIKRTFQMKDTVIAEKDSGVFYFPNQLVYKTPNFKVDTGNRYNNIMYKIRVTNTRTGSISEASTPLVGKNFSIETPIREGNEPYVFFFSPQSLTELKVNRSTNAAILQGFMVFRVLVTLSDNSTREEFWRWQSPGEMSFQNENALAATRSFGGVNFFNFFKTEVSQRGNDNVVSRKLLDGSLEIWGATREYKRYRDVYNNYNSLTQSLPSYTNVVNGLGLVSSINKADFVARISTNTKDSIFKYVPEFKIVK